MDFNLIVSLIMYHFFADWILQPRWLAKLKSEQIKYCLFHGVVILSFLITVIIINSFYSVQFKWDSVIYYSIIYSILHSVQDWFICRIYKYFRKKDIPYQEDYWFYTTIAIDQIIHLVLMFYLVNLMVR